TVYCACAGSVCEFLEGLDCESPWRRVSGITPGALGCRSGSCPQSPLRLVQRYSKCSPLTVLLRPQVQNYSVTRLRLILVGAMASAIQQFLGYSGWASAWRVKCPTLTTGSWLR